MRAVSSESAANRWTEWCVDSISRINGEKHRHIESCKFVSLNCGKLDSLDKSDFVSKAYLGQEVQGTDAVAALLGTDLHYAYTPSASSIDTPDELQGSF